MTDTNKLKAALSLLLQASPERLDGVLRSLSEPETGSGRYSGALKAKVGLEALMGVKTTSQIAREHQVHPLLVTQWKRILLDRMPGIFERGQQAPDESEKTIAHLLPALNVLGPVHCRAM
jgi:transposase-like protein